MGCIVLPGSGDIGSSSSPVIIKTPSQIFWDTTAQGYVDRSLGIFLHFSLATFTDVELEDGTEDPNVFDPGGTYDMEALITAVISAGANYACLTAKHVGGFCMWESATTLHTIASSDWWSLYGTRDIVGEFCTEARSRNIVPCLYFSLWDNNFEVNHPGFTQAQYKTLIEAQLTELLSNYGPLGAIWIDCGDWHFGGSFPWASFAERDAFIYGLQPNCLICDNSHLHDLASSDVVIYEEGNADVPGGNTDPAEFCGTIQTNGSWFWHSGLSPYSGASRITRLSDLNAKNASYLLNFPPDNTGRIPAAYLTVMADIGAR